MEITKEFLETEISSLRKQEAQALATANQCGGAAQVCQQMIEYLETPEEVKPAE